MSVDDFMSLPLKIDHPQGYFFDSLVILPLKESHDSEYPLMDFVSVNNQMALSRLSGVSDVLCLSDSKFDGHTWNFDILPISRLFHVRCPGYVIGYNGAYSSFELIVREK